mmetsp:Transcript_4711/g.4394  ORF Transcript_4711/g.4394 Transcript_4711/m.4394 type:complete len:149 (+) Transcript_4711:879-1325(+)
MTGLVLKRYDGEFFSYDITSGEDMAFHFWINKNSMKDVDELNNESYKIYELLRQPMFLTFVDFDDKRYAKASYKAVEVMKQVAPKFGHLMGLMYCNNTQFQQRKRVLGITWDELPAMAFNTLDQKVLPYPRGKAIEKDEIFSWFDDVM